jgi:hypothetical protein
MRLGSTEAADGSRLYADATVRRRRLGVYFCASVAYWSPSDI